MKKESDFGKYSVAYGIILGGALSTISFFIYLFQSIPRNLLYGALSTISFFITGANPGVSTAFGISAGIIIGAVNSYFLEKNLIENNKMIIPFSMGLGTLIGIGLGLLGAWTYSYSYTQYFATSSITGLALGIVIGLLTYYHKQD